MGIHGYLWELYPEFTPGQGTKIENKGHLWSISRILEL